MSESGEQQPWSPTGRYGSDWSSEWGSGGAFAPGWSTDGLGGRSEPTVLVYDQTAEPAVGIPVKYIHRCSDETGDINNALLVARGPFDSSVAPTIINIGKCPVVMFFATFVGKLIRYISEHTIPVGHELKGQPIPEGADNIGLYCRHCTAGEFIVTIERGFV